MGDSQKTKKQLISELARLRSHVEELERRKGEYQKTKSSTSESEQRLRAIFQTTDNIAFLSVETGSGEFRIVDFSLGAERIFGYGREEIVGQPAALLSIPQDSNKFHNVLTPLKQGDSGFRIDITAVRKSGEHFSALIETCPLIDKNSEIYAVMAIIFDISEQKKIEETYRNNLEIQDLILSAIPAQIYVKDKDFRYIVVSKSVSDFLGIPIDRLQGLTDFDLFSDDIASEIREIDQKIIQTNKPIENYEQRLLGKNGKYAWVSTHKVPLQDKSGNAIGIIGISIDITEKKRIEEQLIQAHKYDAITQMASGIAHNINNILTGIIGNINMAQLKAPEEISCYLRIALKASNQASEMINDLLSFSRKSTASLKLVNMNLIVERVYYLIRPIIDRRIDFNIDIQKNLPQIYADASQINSILMNLCLNAQDAINKDIENNPIFSQDQKEYFIFIKLEKVVLDDIHHLNPSSYPGIFVVLSVSDNGIGMKEETRRRIFEPFYSTKNTVGTGLGLASAFGSIKQHNGWIDFSSEYGNGTTFQIFLPAIEEQVDSDNQNNLMDLSAKGEERILIIDSEELILDLSKEILQNNGYTVLLAKDCFEGIKLIEDETHPIDIIVIDLSMPILPLDESLSNMRKSNSDIKVIISSGYTESLDKDFMDEIEADGFLAKPYHSYELLSTVRRVLDQK